MKNIWHVLKEKESELVRVRQEVEALYLVIPILTEENAAHVSFNEPSLPQRQDTNRWPIDTDVVYSRVHGFSTFRYGS